MNERIKQLAEQATTEEHDGFRYFDKRKFAELIVKECWTTISPFIEDDNLAEDALAELKEHFGVEE
jgi:hypothetical protein